MAWPEQRIAILVIHGIGQQGSFDTLDRFVRNFHIALEDKYPDTAITLAHHLARFESEDGLWAQNFVSLIPNEDESRAVDCYEYFWAHETQRKISMSQVFDWLVDTGKRAENFYNEDASRGPSAEERSGTPFGRIWDRTPLKKFWGRGRFDKNWYLKSAGRALGMIRMFVPVLALAARLPKIGTAVKIGTMLFNKLFRSVVEDVIGDVAVYTSTDRKSEFFPVRQRIINGAVAKIESLAEERQHLGTRSGDSHSNPNYDRVIIVGHSLGTVVGYDALNRINNRINAGITASSVADKLDGFVTFGSPLDKIAYFFRQGGDEKQTILRQIVDQNASFRSSPVNPNIGTLLPHLQSHIHDYVGANMAWVNFWDRKDPISGTLDFYTVNENRRLTMGKPWGKTHIEYWEYREMYDRMIETVIMR